mmetsp:Transcript_14520/g.31093  ORF Transcript_14520/g.31093 Transcript_14520/m.31093 type:complete len:222 (-) Transcript_14520:277-942(-)|eukprot:CAMPEP_0118930862 /NCGR_PEP_ID=MMETSP1169-20130426/7405_1 /TAXON_ID=36882 /ORGANISM="Pyramimonas obovata, Strain CCMP722" /LENGTH=221 /DNA_ID=CAMNT_0006873281 /DNA_START=186 /DNA_END=851 /DNA_ORIENTATION=+
METSGEASDPYEWGPAEVLAHLRRCGVREEAVQTFEALGVGGETFMSLKREDFAEVAEIGEDMTDADIEGILGAIAKVEEVQQAGEAGEPYRADGTHLTIPAVLNDANGRSYFGEHRVPIKSSGAIGTLCELQQTKGVIFRTCPADYSFEWHPAPSKQYLFNLVGGVQITVADGTTRVFKAGSVILMADTEGVGHCSKSVNNEARFSVFVPLADEQGGAAQ